MSRTSKSRGSAPFQMRSGNRPSPNKFLKGLTKAIGSVGKQALTGGFVGQGVQKLFGGGGGGAAGAAAAQGTMADVGTVPGKGMPGMMGGMMGGNMLRTPSAMSKKEQGYTPYKKVGFSCPSPLKGADAVLVRGAYDATSGKGTAKYGQIAKSRAFTNIAKTTGQTFGYLAAQHKMKKEAERKASLSYKKQQWKKDAKFEKWKERKRKGWKDNMRYA